MASTGMCSSTREGLGFPGTAGRQAWGWHPVGFWHCPSWWMGGAGGDFVDNILRWGLFTGVTPISMIQAEKVGLVGGVAIG